METRSRRRNLSDEVADVVRDRIIDGLLTPGGRINEVRLAEELDVSRTPLREALATLVSEGFLTAQPRRGFFVQDLDDQEIGHLYRIRAILDPAALRMAGLPDKGRLDRLERLNQRILATRGNPPSTIEVDDAWHIEILAGCPNTILLGLIRTFMQRTRPYEHAYMRENANVDVVVREHRKIMAKLEAGDLEGACDALFQNMQTAVEPLLEWRRTHRERTRNDFEEAG